MAATTPPPPTAFLTTTTTTTTVLLLLCLLILAPPSTAATTTATTTTQTTAPTHAPRSAKRGLIYITNTTPTTPFLVPSSDLTWYYNYGFTPTPSLANSTTLQYVPMLWGDTATGFAASITAQFAASNSSSSSTNSNSTNTPKLTTLLAFNEPDACSGGGSCLTPARAAALWRAELAPLQHTLGLRVGSPATVGSPAGAAWMRAWLRACAGGCRPDFLAVHWYGDFEGLAAWMGQVNASFAGALAAGAGAGGGEGALGGMWITEFADPNAPLAATQATYNTSTQYFDRLAYVERYAYFGAFESSVSNVGPNVAMLDQDGRLTDIGSWYLGGAATGNIPMAAAAAVGVPWRTLVVMVVLVSGGAVWGVVV